MKRTILLFLMAIGMLSCNEKPHEKNDPAGKYHLRGCVQKGQYIRGSTITAFQLDKNLSATGKSFPSQITDDMGSFAIGNNLEPGFVELIAMGYYFNENTHEISESQLTLQAIESTSKGAINVNLLTTLTSPRIKRLIKGGMDFEKAVAKAEREIRTAFGFGDAGGGSERFTDLDITQGGDSDAMLLAISCTLQQDRSTGQLSELIAQIASDLADDGLLSDDLKKGIAESASNVSVGSIIEGLLDFYTEKQIENYTIPPIYKFMDMDGDGKPEGDAPVFLMISPMRSYPAGYPGGPVEGFAQTDKILCTFDFSVTTDCDWITIEKTRLAECIYAIDFTIHPNTGKQRKGEIIYRKGGPTGEILSQTSILQASAVNFQYIFLSFGSEILHEGDRVLANGQTIETSFFQNTPYIELNPAAQHSVCYPIEMVSPVADDILFCTVDYPATIPAKASVPYYGALKPYMDIPIGNPASILMQMCCALMDIDLSAYDRMEEVASVRLEADTDAVLSGKATYLIYEDEPQYVPSYKPGPPSFTDASNSITIALQEGETRCKVPIYPQTMRKLTVKLCNRNDTVLYSGELVTTETRFYRSRIYSFEVR